MVLCFTTVTIVMSILLLLVPSCRKLLQRGTKSKDRSIVTVVITTKKLGGGGQALIYNDVDGEKRVK